VKSTNPKTLLNLRIDWSPVLWTPELPAQYAGLYRRAITGIREMWWGEHVAECHVGLKVKKMSGFAALN